MCRWKHMLHFSENIYINICWEWIEEKFGKVYKLVRPSSSLVHRLTLWNRNWNVQVFRIYKKPKHQFHHFFQISISNGIDVNVLSTPTLTTKTSCNQFVYFHLLKISTNTQTHTHTFHYDYVFGLYLYADFLSHFSLRRKWIRYFDQK